MADQAGQVVGPTAGADGVDVEHPDDPAVGHAELALVQVAVRGLVTLGVGGQARDDLLGEPRQLAVQLGQRRRHHARVVADGVGPRRPSLQPGDGRRHGVQQLDDLLGPARLALLEEGVRERGAGELARDEQLVVGGQEHLGRGDAALTEQRVAAKDIGEDPRPQHLDVQRRPRVGDVDSHHGAAARPVADHREADLLGSQEAKRGRERLGHPVGVRRARQPGKVGVVGVQPHGNPARAVLEDVRPLVRRRQLAHARGDAQQLGPLPVRPPHGGEVGGRGRR